MATQTFELVSPFLSVYAPSKKWDTSKSDLLLGQTSTRLVTGELLSYFGANSVTRPDSGIVANAVLPGIEKFVAPYFSETGRGDIVTGGNVPVLQFGPFEADTMLFMREGDDSAAIAAGAFAGNLTAGAHNALNIGEKVFAAPVRNPLTGNLSATDYVIGVAPASGISNAASAVCVGRISRIIGSGAKAKIRVMFGVN